MSFGKPTVEEQFSIELGCRVNVEAGVGYTRVDWSVAHLSGEDRRRPRQGTSVESFTCPRCRQEFCVTVENSATARRKRVVYQVLGALLLLSLLFTVPMLVQLGGQTVDENDPNATDGIGLLLLSAAVGFVAGLTFFRLGRAHLGITKFRRVGTDGGSSVRVKGHRLF
ncbi:hypothetical protein ACIA8O_04570 [Kitasatospora sp. NPDC051853]|uniref:hypothetical protein n=1 Tax=Kitasatospora sp. NPDC051853 TaxID=3364058 RepID=UPI0037AA4909